MTNLQHREDEIHQTDEIEDDEIGVVKEVRLRVDRHVDEAVDVDGDREHDVRAALHKQHAFHVHDSLQHDHDHDEADPHHRSGLDGA